MVEKSSQKLLDKNFRHYYNASHEGRGGEWIRCTRRERCSICSKPDWCTRTADGKYACCMRVDAGSIKRTKNGGYLHEIDPSVKRAALFPPPKPKPTFDTDRIELDRTKIPLDHGVSGVDPSTLCLLGAWWSKHYDALAIPMFDPHRVLSGVRIRARAGKKWSWPGGHEGIFLPAHEPTDGEPVFVCEGPTDCAAMNQIGLWALGRPSNLGAKAAIVEFLRSRRASRPVILADRDPAGSRAEDATLRGALALGIALRPYSVRIIRPLCKDVREWIGSGATREAILCLAENAIVQ